MVSIFTTKTSLENFYQEDNAWYKMVLKLNEVFIDEDPFSDIDNDAFDPENNVFLTLDKMGVKINDDAAYINDIPNNPSTVLQHPCGIFLLNISPAKAFQIQKDYGVICQSISSLNHAPLTQSHIPTELMDGEQGKPWKGIIGKYYMLPSNSVLVIDAHLFSNDYFDNATNRYDEKKRNGLDNL